MTRSPARRPRGSCQPLAAARLAVLVVASVAASLAASLGACRNRPSVCPAGYDERPGKRADTTWCQQRGGKRAQLLQRFAEGGRKRQVCLYDDGMPQGRFEGWHPNGKPWLTGQFKAGKPDGHWLQVNEQGVKVAEGEYRDGRLVQGAPVAVGALCESESPGKP